MSSNTLVVDLTITEAEVMYGETARVGDRVKHFGERFTGLATATVVGFNRCGDIRPSQIKVIVKPDNSDSPYASLPGWDWDRTELV